MEQFITQIPNIAVIHREDGKIQKEVGIESHLFPKSMDYWFITDKRNENGERIAVRYAYAGQKDNEGYHFYKNGEC